MLPVGLRDPAATAAHLPFADPLPCARIYAITPGRPARKVPAPLGRECQRSTTPPLLQAAGVRASHQPRPVLVIGCYSPADLTN